MSDELRKFLAKFASDMVKETKKLLSEYGDDMEKAASSWQSMASTMARKRSGKPLVSAAAKAMTVGEAVGKSSKKRKTTTAKKTGGKKRGRKKKKS